MPEHVLHQIQFLCQQIAKVEWSGILFYSVEGSIKDPANMVITLQDILPMHKGTSTFTEYTFDERVIDHMMDNEHLEDCKMGHIHSHNTMGVFFSGTDWSELEDNAPNHNFYLSLIVNNFMDFCAKVCFIAETNEAKEFNFEAKDENGNKYVYKTENFEVNTKKLVVYDCEINSPIKNISVQDNFKTKVEGIIKEAEKKTIPVNTTGHNVTSHVAARTFSDNYKPSTGTNSSTGKFWIRNDNKVKDKDNWDFNSFHKRPKNNPAIKHMMFSDIAFDEVIDDFSMVVLNTGNDVSPFADIEDIVEFYAKKNIKGNMLASNVINSYVNTYEKYFETLDVKNHPNSIEEILKATIEKYQHEADTSTLAGIEDMLKPVIDGLTLLLIEFQNFEEGVTK